MQPICKFQAGHFQDPIANRDNKIGFFSHRNELIGGHQSLLGVYPADKAFKANQIQSVEFNDWLIKDDKLIPFQGLMQIALDVQKSGGLFMHYRTEGLDGVQSLQFGPVHGHFRVPDHVIGLHVLG